VKLKYFKSVKLYIFDIDNIKDIAIKTNTEPNWVHIIKYREACIDLLLGLTKYTIRNEGINNNS
jgi:hypothetical protein